MSGHYAQMVTLRSPKVLCFYSVLCYIVKKSPGSEAGDQKTWERIRFFVGLFYARFIQVNCATFLQLGIEAFSAATLMTIRKLSSRIICLLASIKSMTSSFS